MKSNLALLALALAVPAAAQQSPSIEQITDEVLRAFIGAAQFQHQKDQQAGTRPLQMRRPVFTKAHGCVVGRFDILARDPRLFHGIFNMADRALPRAYAAWIRFSNDGAPGADNVFNGEPGRNPNRGMAIKLVGVPGPKILDGETNALTQDFILQNHPKFFVDDALGFLDLLRDRNFRKNHPKSDEIMTAMEKRVVSNPLLTPYWTPTPYGFGAGNTYKYFVKPTTCPGFPVSRTPNPMVNPDFLHENLSSLLRAGPACFDFFGQFFVNEQVTPTDRAMTEWTEAAAPPQLLAKITINQQDIDRIPNRAARCETLSFNPWHSVPAHTPAGSLNLLRKKVYQESAKFRRVTSNRLDTRLVAEPTQILPTE